MLHVILNPSDQTVSCPLPMDMVDGHDLTGKTVLDVSDEFTWLMKTVDWSTMTIIDDVEKARLDRRKLIDEWRDQAEWAGCETALGVMDTDPTSQRKLSGTVQMALIAQSAGETFNITWTMADNTDVAHDAAQIIAAGLAVGQHVATCHATSRTLKAAVEAAETLEDIAAVVWPS